MDDNFDKGTVGNYLGRLGLLILVSVYSLLRHGLYHGGRNSPCLYIPSQ